MANETAFPQKSDPYQSALQYRLACVIQLEEKNYEILNVTGVRFASFLSGGFITTIVVNPPERKLAKRTYVQYWKKTSFLIFRY